MGTFNRTNRTNSFYQLRETVRAFADSQNVDAPWTRTFRAVVIYVDPVTVPFTSNIPNAGNKAAYYAAHAAAATAALNNIQKYKIHFRVPGIHSFLPLPPSFRRLRPTLQPSILPDLKGSGNGSNRLSCLKPEAEEGLLISVHPSLYVPITNDGETPARLNPGDIIEVNLPEGKFENAEFVKVIQQGLNIVDQTDLDFSSIDIKDLFDELTSDVASTGPGPGTGWDPEKKIDTKFPEQFSLEKLLVNDGQLANLPNQDQFQNLQKLVTNVLDPLQKALSAEGHGKIYITSGFRNEEANKNADGVKNSQHTKGQAADMLPPQSFGGTTEARAEAFFNFIKANNIGWRGDLIWYPIKGHNHIEFISDATAANAFKNNDKEQQ